MTDVAVDVSDVAVRNLMEENRQLTERVELFRQYRDNLQTRLDETRRDYNREAEKLTTEFKEFAEENDLENDYQDIAERLNRNFDLIALPYVKREYTVYVTYTVPFTVTAVDEDDAKDQMDDDASNLETEIDRSQYGGESSKEDRYSWNVEVND